MKVELTLYLLDFLAERKYQYLLLQLRKPGSKLVPEKFTFIPAKNFENISHYYSGSSSCFYLEAEPRVMAEGIKGKLFYVFLNMDEAIEFKSYLSKIASRKRAYLDTVN